MFSIRPFDPRFPLPAELCFCLSNRHASAIPFLIVNGERGIKLIPKVLDGLNKAVDTHIVGRDIWLRSLRSTAPCGNACPLESFSSSANTSTISAVKEDEVGRPALRSKARRTRQQRGVKGGLTGGEGEAEVEQGREERRSRRGRRARETQLATTTGVDDSGETCQQKAGTGAHRLVMAGTVSGDHFNSLSTFAVLFFGAWQKEKEKENKVGRGTGTKVATPTDKTETLCAEEAMRLYWRTLETPLVAGSGQSSMIFSRYGQGGFPSVSSPSSSSSSTLSASTDRADTGHNWVVQYMPSSP